MTFAEKMRELRDAKGLSEAKLAVAAGVPFGTVHNISIGRSLPTFAVGIKLARALDVSSDVFAQCEDIAGEDPEPEKSAPKKKPKGGK